MKKYLSFKECVTFPISLWDIRYFLNSVKHVTQLISFPPAAHEVTSNATTQAVLSDNRLSTEKHKQMWDSFPYSVYWFVHSLPLSLTKLQTADTCKISLKDMTPRQSRKKWQVASSLRSLCVWMLQMNVELDFSQPKQSDNCWNGLFFFLLWVICAGVGKTQLNLGRAVSQGWHETETQWDSRMLNFNIMPVYNKDQHHASWYMSTRLVQEKILSPNILMTVMKTDVFQMQMLYFSKCGFKAGLISVPAVDTVHWY